MRVSEPAVGPCLAERDLLQCGPHRFLEIGAGEMQRQVERRQFAVEIGGELLGDMLEAVLVADPGRGRFALALAGLETEAMQDLAVAGGEQIADRAFGR